MSSGRPWDQYLPAGRKPFGRNDIYIDRTKKIEGFFIVDSINCPNGIKLYNSKMGGVELMDQLKSADGLVEVS